MYFTESQKANQAESLMIMAKFRSRYDRVPGQKDPDAVVNEAMCQLILEDCDYTVPELRAKIGRHKSYVDQKSHP